MLIHPISEAIEARIKFIQQFPMLRMVESIDDKSFYSSCASFDSSIGYPLIANIVNVMRKIGTKSKIDIWFKETGLLKNKRSTKEQQIRRHLETIINRLLSRKSYSNILSLIEAIEGLPDVKIYRKEFLQDICKSSAKKRSL